MHCIASRNSPAVVEKCENSTARQPIVQKNNSSYGEGRFQAPSNLRPTNFGKRKRLGTITRTSTHLFHSVIMAAV